MFTYIKSFFIALNANAHPHDIAHGVALATVLALIPRNNLLWIVVFVLSLCIRTNKGAFFLTLIVFSFLTPFLDIVLERFGYFLLTRDFAKEVYTNLESIPFVALTKFNNSIVFGSFVVGLLLYVPMFIIVKIKLNIYRKHLQPLIVASPLFKFVTNLPLIKHILKAPTIGGML